jgi:hypothetical protein
MAVVLKDGHVALGCGVTGSPSAEGRQCVGTSAWISSPRRPLAECAGSARPRSASDRLPRLVILRGAKGGLARGREGADSRLLVEYIGKCIQ